MQDWGFETVAFVAKILDSDNIPNVLWGNRLINFYGVPTIIDVRLTKECLMRRSQLMLPHQSVSFIIPDTRLSQAVSALLSAGFAACEEKHNLLCELSSTSLTQAR